MVEKHLTDGTTALAGQPRVIKIEAAEKPRNAHLRVAAYTRVSSDSDDQLNSFAAQNRYYAELISGKAEWRMVDIYADEGITGTSAAKREDFQRMMADCRRGLIDQILVKSISRFARNTKDCLEAVRELKELGVNVRFEREGHRHRQCEQRAHHRHLCRLRPKGERIHLRQYALELSAQDGSRDFPFPRPWPRLQTCWQENRNRC